MQVSQISRCFTFNAKLEQTEKPHNNDSIKDKLTPEKDSAWTYFQNQIIMASSDHLRDKVALTVTFTSESYKSAFLICPNQPNRSTEMV